MTDVVDLRRAAEDLEKKMKACSEVKSYDPASGKAHGARRFSAECL